MNEKLKGNWDKLVAAIVLIIGGILLFFFNNDNAYITSIFPSEYIKHTNIAFILLGFGLLISCCFNKNNILFLTNIVYFPLLFTGITYIVNFIVSRIIPNSFIDCMPNWGWSAFVLYLSSFINFFIVNFILKDLSQSDKNNDINNKVIDNKNSQKRN